ncbi:metallophosphoesterase [Porphyromonas sp.]|uniref:metallophosphoesterase n=1 Tax=Porphyromonas sp. TaxID=1924944 RepID=UPI0026DAE9FD|nr:metallophosphoesterase [Porphyromonas sp.]MDO4770431.1 metallophosphoesterase [Porphyromonas sp.]
MNQISTKKILKIVVLAAFSLAMSCRFSWGIDIAHRDSIDSNKKNSVGLLKGQKLRSTDKKRQVATLDGVDGPYLVGSKIYRVDASNNLYVTPYKAGESILVEVRNGDTDRFHVRKKDKITLSPDIYPMPNKLIAISDIEGNFDGFASFLMNHQVIDKEFNWSFGDGHLVLVGDFVDRGDNVTAVLWLIYKLEDQAEKYGGKVHYILGNHELLNFQGQYRYNDPRYLKISSIVSGEDDLDDAIQFMYSDQTELGKWLHSKNGIEKIGDYVFVHAGLSPRLLDLNLSISRINDIVRQNWDKNVFAEPDSDETVNFLLGSEGIFWFRGFMKGHKYYPKITLRELQDVLAFFDAKAVVFGHTVVDDVTKFFDGRIINIDVKHGQVKHSEKTKGLLIENGVEYKLDGKGTKTPL